MAGYVQDHTEAMKQIELTKLNYGGQEWDTTTAYRENLQIARNVYGMSGIEAEQRALQHTKSEVVSNYDSHMYHQEKQDQSQGQRIG